jgi:hypothetical protein
MSSPTTSVYSLPNKTTLLYSVNNLTIGKTGSKVSGLLDVSPYYTKAFAYYLGVTQSASGSFTVSGSFDGSNYFNVTGSADFFDSGSFAYIVTTVPFTSVQVALKNVGTGSSVSGSIWVVGQK